MEYALKMIRIGEGDDQTGIKPALCFRGRKVVHAVLNDDTAVRAVEISLKTYDLAAPVLQNGQPYPVSRFIAHMGEIGKRKGITRRAAALLGAGASLPSDEGIPPDDIATESLGETQERPKPAPEITPVRPAVPPKTATAPRSPKPAATPRPPPAKASKTATKEPRSTAKPKLSQRTKSAAPPGSKSGKNEPNSTTVEKYGGRGNSVRDLAKELETDPKSLRIKLRAAGLRAPYTDVKAMKKALGIK